MEEQEIKKLRKSLKLASLALKMTASIQEERDSLLQEVLKLKEENKRLLVSLRDLLRKEFSHED